MPVAPVNGIRPELAEVMPSSSRLPTSTLPTRLIGLSIETPQNFFREYTKHGCCGVCSDDMKRILFASVAAALLLGVLGLIYLGTNRPPNQGQWQRVFSAMRIYQEQMRKAGQPVPESTSPQDLIERKLLSASDGVGLEGVKIRLLATPKLHDPTAVLAEVIMPDGTRLAALADGSAQMLPKNAD